MAISFSFPVLNIYVDEIQLERPKTPHWTFQILFIKNYLQYLKYKL